MKVILLLKKSQFFIVVLFATQLLFSQAKAYDAKKQEELQNKLPAELESVGIDDKSGNKLNQKISFRNEEGGEVQLQQYFKNGKPVVFSLVYFTCPNICNIHLEGVFKSFKELDLVPGKDFEYVAISFNSEDTPEQAKAGKKTLMDRFELNPELAKGIHFLTGTQESIDLVTKELGFRYQWDEESGEWSHGSAAILVNGEGTIARYLHGVHFPKKTMQFSLVEVSQGKIGSLIDQIILFCFTYDPKGNQYAASAFKIMQLGGGATVFILALWLIPFWLRHRRQLKLHQGAQNHV